MYYNSNNNDYYNAYKQEILELKTYKKEEERQKLLKNFLLFLLLVLFTLIVFYLYKYFNPLLEIKKESLPSIVIKEETLPKSIQLRESSIQIAKNIQNNATDTEQPNKQKTSNINKKDIGLIVPLIIYPMNTQPKKPLELQLKEVNEKKFINKKLKQTNHYNKIILTENESQEVQNASLMQLNTRLRNIMNEELTSNSNYTQEIKKEVAFRKNEMRVIIVQKGDTLSRIAKRAYGNSNDYPKIFVANPEIIKNPNQIFVGQRLRIPS